MQLVRVERAPVLDRGRPSTTALRPTPRPTFRTIDAVPIVVTIIRDQPPIGSIRRALAAYAPATDVSRLLAIA